MRKGKVTMMGRMRRGIGLLLVCCMLLTLMPMAAFAAPGVDDDWETGDFGYDLLVENLFSRLEPCEPILFEEPLSANFEDDAVVIVLTRAASRDNRTFTAEDFSDVGAVYVADLDRLSDRESSYVQPVWEAEELFLDALLETERVRSAEAEQVIDEVRQVYAEARAEAEANTLVNFDEYRRILFIRLNQNCRENVLHVIGQLEQREYIRAAEPNFIFLPD